LGSPHRLYNIALLSDRGGGGLQSSWRGCHYTHLGRFEAEAAEGGEEGHLKGGLHSWATMGAHIEGKVCPEVYEELLGAGIGFVS